MRVLIYRYDMMSGSHHPIRIDQLIPYIWPAILYSIYIIPQFHINSNWLSFLILFRLYTNNWLCEHTDGHSNSDGQPLFAGIRAASAQPDGDAGRWGRPVVSRRSSRRLQSRLDQVGFESHSGHPHARHHAQHPHIRAPLWPFRLAAGHRRRPARGRRPIHVPNQHGSHEKSGII